MTQIVNDELLIEDGEKLIWISMDQPKETGWLKTSDGEMIREIDHNQIEISYREDDEGGTGIGGGEYFSTTDIRDMAAGIRSVINHQAGKFSYVCQDDVFRLELCYDMDSDTFTFTAAMIETLNREYHISITKENLTIIELDGYIQPFFEWERAFPVYL